MFAEYFDAAGPVMYAVFAAWVVVLAGILDRLLYVLGVQFRQPLAEMRRLAGRGDLAGARERFEVETRRATRGLSRIDAVSQIATSVGLFGTVLGIARTFFASGAGGLEGAVPEVLSSGLSTALFTTVGGLIVFLFGQAFLIVWHEWLEARERHVAGLLAGESG